MKEIEVKFNVDDFTEIRKKLRELHAKLDWKGLEQSYFFDSKDGTLRDSKKSLRLRTWSGHSNTMTLKVSPRKRSKKYKIKHEFEVEVNDIPITRKILKELGFREYMRYRKYREHWKLSDAAVELDTLQARLPGQQDHNFVEIEASKERINELAEYFGLSWEQTERRGYVSLLKEINAEVE
jgi:predicted adenylyl cyclase CyaB